VGKNVSWNCDTICQLSKEHSMIGFRSHEQKVNPATDYFCARLFPLSFFWLKAFWYSFCCICEKCLFSYEVSYPWTTSWMMFFFAQETWFQWFCKADCLCREKVIGLFAVFAQILDHSAEFFVCDAHKCWIVSGFCSQNGVVTFCESCLLVRFLMNAATLKKKKKWSGFFHSLL